MRLQLHKPHVALLLERRGEKGKFVVKSAVILRALDTYLSTTGDPSASSFLRNLRNKGQFVWRKTKDCF